MNEGTRRLSTWNISGKDQVYCNAKVQTLRDGTKKITCFSRPVFRRDGFEEIEFKSLYEAECELLRPPRQEIKKKSVKNMTDSTRRAKNKIFEIALANKWDYMITGTLDGDIIDRYDAAAFGKKLKKWLDNQVQRRGISYLVIPERHKDGAIHIHGLISEGLDMIPSGTYKIPGKKKPVKLSTLKKRGIKPEDAQEVFNIKGWKYGFSTAVKIGGSDTDAQKVSTYMTKYITKDMEKIFGNFTMRAVISLGNYLSSAATSIMPLCPLNMRLFYAKILGLLNIFTARNRISSF